MQQLVLQQAATTQDGPLSSSLQVPAGQRCMQSASAQCRAGAKKQSLQEQMQDLRRRMEAKQVCAVFPLDREAPCRSFGVRRQYRRSHMLAKCFNKGYLMFLPSVLHILKWLWCAQEAHCVALHDRDSRCEQLMQELRSLQGPPGCKGRDQEPCHVAKEPVALCMPPDSQARPSSVMSWSCVQALPCSSPFNA